MTNLNYHSIQQLEWSCVHPQTSQVSGSWAWCLPGQFGFWTWPLNNTADQLVFLDESNKDECVVLHRYGCARWYENSEIRSTTYVQSFKKLSQCFTVSWCLVYNTILSNGITSRKMYLIVYHVCFWMTLSLLNLDITRWYNISNKTITHWDSFFDLPF